MVIFAVLLFLKEEWGGQRRCLTTFQHFLYPHSACEGEKDERKREEPEEEKERAWETNALL